MRKRLVAVSIVIASLCLFAGSAQAQLKGLNKAAQKTVKDASSSAKEMAKETANDAANSAQNTASDMAANKVAVKVINWLDTYNTILPASDKYSQRLDSLVGSKYTNVDGTALNYKVYQNKEANIIATEEGSIRVYSGMMDLLDDDQLLGAIAIQIGHIKNKDLRKSLIKIVAGENAGNVTVSQLEKVLSLSEDKLGIIANELIQVPYTDEQNTEADKYATELLKKNEADVKILKSALEKFGEIESKDAGASPAYKYIVVNSKNAQRAKNIK